MGWSIASSSTLPSMKTAWAQQSSPSPTTTASASWMGRPSSGIGASSSPARFSALTVATGTTTVTMSRSVAVVITVAETPPGRVEALVHAYDVSFLVHQEKMHAMMGGTSMETATGDTTPPTRRFCWARAQPALLWPWPLSTLWWSIWEWCAWTLPCQRDADAAWPDTARRQLLGIALRRATPPDVSTALPHLGAPGLATLQAWHHHFASAGSGMASPVLAQLCAPTHMLPRSSRSPWSIHRASRRHPPRQSIAAACFGVLPLPRGRPSS